MVVSDLVPMIIPPTSSKNTYYANLSMRAQWAEAARALAASDHLIVIGCSLPESDLTVRHLLATSFRGPDLTIVNPDPTVVERFQQLIPNATNVTTFCSDRATQEFVEERCGDIIAWGVRNAGAQGWKPYVTRNGEDEMTAIDRERPSWDLHDDASSSRAWLADYVKSRWPGVEARALRDLGEEGREAQYDAQIAYVP
jgi:hypothetical protein